MHAYMLRILCQLQFMFRLVLQAVKCVQCSMRRYDMCGGMVSAFSRSRSLVKVQLVHLHLMQCRTSREQALVHRVPLGCARLRAGHRALDSAHECARFPHVLGRPVRGAFVRDTRLQARPRARRDRTTPPLVYVAPCVRRVARAECIARDGGGVVWRDREEVVTEVVQRPGGEDGSVVRVGGVVWAGRVREGWGYNGGSRDDMWWREVHSVERLWPEARVSESVRSHDIKGCIRRVCRIGRRGRLVDHHRIVVVAHFEDD
jgi:hypothetical protein